MSATTIFAAFKGIGDLLTALPTVKFCLDSGESVALLIFPKLRPVIDLVDFGPGRERLDLYSMPVGNGAAGLREFVAAMALLSPRLVWISPHSPLATASWKLPLLLCAIKRLWWRDAVLAGAESERFSRLFDRRVPLDRSLPLAAREWVGFSTAAACAGSPPRLEATAGLRRRRDLRPSYDLLIHPGSEWLNKSWPSTSYARLLALLPAGLRIAVIALPEQLEALRSALPPDREVSFLVGSVAELALAIAASRVLLALDSGPMHLANLIGVPCVALFGPTDPRTVLTGNGSVRPIYVPGLPCQPCESSRCSQSAVHCMAAIEPSRVADAILHALETTARQAAVAS